MSPLWLDPLLDRFSGRLRLSLAPDRVHLVRQSAWGRPGAMETLDCSEELAEQDDHGRPWFAPIQALSRHLSQTPAAVGIKPGLEVLLSSHFVRLLMLPWQAGVYSAEERQSYARSYFRQIHGAVADGWRVSLADMPPGQASPICAVDGALVDALEELAGSRGYRLTSIEAGLVATAARLSKSFRDTSLLAMVEPGRLSCILAQNGQWQGFASLALDAQLAWDFAALWPGVLARLGLAATTGENGHLYLGRVEGALPETAAPVGWTRQPLPDAVPGGWLGWSTL